MTKKPINWKQAIALGWFDVFVLVLATAGSIGYFICSVRNLVSTIWLQVWVVVLAFLWTLVNDLTQKLEEEVHRLEQQARASENPEDVDRTAHRLAKFVAWFQPAAALATVTVSGEDSPITKEWTDEIMNSISALVTTTANIEEGLGGLGDIVGRAEQSVLQLEETARAILTFSEDMRSRLKLAFA